MTSTNSAPEIVHRSPESIVQWENAGTQLENAITNYLSSCLQLEKDYFAPLVGTENTQARLDSRIEHFHTLFTQPLAQSLASVTRTRNKLATSIYRLPPEILAKIFEYAVHAFIRNRHLRYAIIDSRRCLHRLLGVSSVWREIGLAHVPLWTLVPLVCFEHSNPSRITTQSAELSLERAGQSGLRLALDARDYPLEGLYIMDKLVEHGHRFSSVHLRTSSLYALEYALGPIAQMAASESIHEISLCHDDYFTSLPRPTCVFAPRLPSNQASYERMIASARLLRLNNVILRMDDVHTSFSNLVELRIQAVRFQSEVSLKESLRRLISAPHLQTLDIISVEVHALTSAPTTDSAPFSLPNLQTLFIQGLLCNVLQLVLSIIEPGLHRTVISVSNDMLIPPIQEPDDDIDAGIYSLQSAIHPHKVDTLVLAGYWDERGSAGVLRSFISKLPHLTTMYLYDQNLDRETLAALTRPLNDTDTHLDFPNLRRIYISNCTIDDIGNLSAFRNMLASHPLEELVLGGIFREVDLSGQEWSSSEDIEHVNIAGSDMRAAPIINWLREAIPSFTLLGPSQYFKFRWTEWQLW
ncbi:unnamed protein product [Rhizoctonia solani]|uniref:F-box domain-containing protein n=1 Tax=Rhizoctonia solani TaxID=456999 RepID=A0A8H3DRF6_9AGAM|nr:unnamed protein product [Rhizoctonia solani]